MVETRHSESIVIEGSPEDLYELVAGLAHMGEWSPVCTGCEYDEGSGPEVGAWFVGHNEVPGRVWDTRSVVVAAKPAEEFAFEVGEARVARWGYSFEPVDGGTKVTESWEFLPGGHTLFEERYGERAQEEIANRYELMLTGIPATLAAIKATAES